MTEWTRFLVHVPRITFFTHPQDGTQWGETTLTGNEKIEDTVQCVSTSGRPGHATIQVRRRKSEGKPCCCLVVDSESLCCVDSESLLYHGTSSVDSVLLVAFRFRRPCPR